MTGSLQAYKLPAGSAQGVGGRLIYEGFVPFVFADVFTQDVIPYDPDWEDPSGYADVNKYRPVGCRVADADLEVINTPNVPYVIADGAEIRNKKIFASQITTANDTDQFLMEDVKFIPTFTTMPTANRAMIRGHNNNLGGSVIRWCSIGGPSANVSSWQNCVDGGNYLFEYCALSRGVDAFHMDLVGNGKAHGCVASHGHNYWWWNAGTNAVRTANFTDADGIARVIGEVSDGHSDGSLHSDAAQTAGWTGWEFDGSRLGMSPRWDNNNPVHLDPTVAADLLKIKGYDGDPTFLNASIIFNMDGVHKLGALVKHCLLAEGAATLNLPWRTEDNGDGVTIQDSLIVPNAHGYQIYKQTVTGSAAQTVTNVLRSDTRAPASIQGY
jgi:hypothetical protein